MANSPSSTNVARSLTAALTLAIASPFVLFSIFLLVSRLGIRALNGPGDIPAVVICVLVGGGLTLRLPVSLAMRIVFTPLYLFALFFVLMVFGWCFDCWFVHDCD